jgi:hypothetical protein
MPDFDNNILDDTLNEVQNEEDTFEQAEENEPALEKTDTQDEVETWKKRYEELQKKIGEQGEELGRLRGLLMQYSNNKPIAPIQQETKIGDKIFEDPDAALNEFAERQRQQVLLEMQRVIEAERREQEFWSKNQDLKPFQEVVNMVAVQVARENPYATPEEKADLIARKSREKIANWQKLLMAQEKNRRSSKPPKVTSPSPVRGGNKANTRLEDDDPFDEEYFKLRSKMRTKRLF